MNSSVVGRSLHKSKSNEKLYRCYASVVDDKISCESDTLYEKMPQFCEQQNTKTLCEGTPANMWCSWIGSECILKNTGTLDLVKD